MLDDSKVYLVKVKINISYLSIVTGPNHVETVVRINEGDKGGHRVG